MAMDQTLAQLLNHIYELEVEKAEMIKYIQENCPPVPQVVPEVSNTEGE